MREKTAGEITKAALEILDKEMNIEAWKYNNVQAYKKRTFQSKTGVADIIGFVRPGGLNREGGGAGSLVMCEVKKIGDSFKPAQIELLTKVHKAGAVALWATQEGMNIVVKKFLSDN